MKKKKSKSAPAYSRTDTTDMYRLFECLSIPTRVTVPIIKQIDNWITTNGAEWTISRLKSLKFLYLQHYAGNKAFRLDNALGIKLHRDGQPYGPFRALWTMGYAYRIVNKVLNILNVYSAFIVLGDATPTQLNKFLTAVERPKQAGLLPEWNITPEHLLLWKDIWHRSKYDRNEQWTRTTKKVIHLDRGRGIVKTPEKSMTFNDHVADALAFMRPWFKQYSVRMLFVRAGVNEVKFVAWILNDLMTSIETEIEGLKSKPDAPSRKKAIGLARSLLTMQNSKKCPIVGSIGFIQERGFKLRAVANPLRLIQIVLSRLKNALAEFQRTCLYFDCTFDQGKGVRWAQRKLAQGVKLHAFDLSNASDTIPLVDQVSLLNALLPDTNDIEYIGALDLLHLVARGIWKMKLPNGNTKDLVWTKGQPLGIGPSFGLFSMAHGMRLYQLSQELDLNDSFVVLGDDVIVVDGLQASYSSFLTERWGCDFSIEKTITSEFLTEFASKLTTATRQHKTYKFPKSIRIFNYADPTDVIKRYGKKALKLVPSHVRPMVQTFCSLPKALGGQGIKWNKTDVLLYDGYGPRSILSLKTRKPVLDVIEPTFFRRPGAKYDSVIFRELPYIEREQDLVVAFRGIYNKNSNPTPGEMIGFFGKRSPPDFLHKPKRKKREVLHRHSTSVTPTQMEWIILHANANLNNEGFEIYHKAVVDMAKPFKTDIITRQIVVKGEKSAFFSKEGGINEEQTSIQTSKLVRRVLLSGNAILLGIKMFIQGKVSRKTRKRPK